MTVEDMIELLKQMPPKQELLVIEDGGIYDWSPVRVFTNNISTYITNKEPKRSHVRQSTRR